MKLWAFFTFGLFFGFSNAFAASYDDAIVAAKLNDSSALIQVLQAGLSPNTTDEQGNTLLILSAREGSKDSLAALLKFKETDLNAHNLAGDNALNLAAYQGHLKIVQLLIENGANINAGKWPALIYAALQKQTPIVRYLLKHHANINAQSPNGTTALMAAARSGSMEIVQLLVEQNAQLNLQTDRQQTALSIALQKGNTDIAQFLKDKGAQ